MPLSSKRIADLSPTPFICINASNSLSKNGGELSNINSKLDKMVNLAEDLGLAEIIDTEMEIIHL